MKLRLKFLDSQGQRLLARSGSVHSATVQLDSAASTVGALATAVHEASTAMASDGGPAGPLWLHWLSLNGKEPLAFALSPEDRAVQLAALGVRSGDLLWVAVSHRQKEAVEQWSRCEGYQTLGAPLAVDFR